MRPMSKHREHRRSQVQTRVHRFKPGQRWEEADDLAYWQQIPIERRFEEAWSLSLEQWMLAHRDYDPERGLSRSVASIRRG